MEPTKSFYNEPQLNVNSQHGLWYSDDPLYSQSDFLNLSHGEI